MKKLLFVLVVCAVVAGMANAAVYRYEGNGAWENASITEGWTLDNGATHPGVLPGALDEPRMNWGGATVTVSTAVPTVFRVYPGCDEAGNLIVHNGGVVTMTDCLMMAVGGNPNTGSTLTVEAGGTVTAGGHLWVAENAASTGILNVSGTVNIGGIIGLGGVGFGAGGIGTVNVLNGGVLHLSNIHGDLVNLPSIHLGSLIDITGTGLVTLPNDFVAVAQAYINAGRIHGIVVPIFDENTGVIIQTNIVAIPEPITISLLGLGALALLRKRS
jgi:hypothetical protein